MSLLYRCRRNNNTRTFPEWIMLYHKCNRLYLLLWLLVVRVRVYFLFAANVIVCRRRCRVFHVYYAYLYVVWRGFITHNRTIIDTIMPDKEKSSPIANPTRPKRWHSTDKQLHIISHAFTPFHYHSEVSVLLIISQFSHHIHMNIETVRRNIYQSEIWTTAAGWKKNSHLYHRNRQKLFFALKKKKRKNETTKIIKKKI